MGQLNTKYGQGFFPNLQRLELIGLKDGIRYDLPPELIPLTAMQKADNWEQDPLTGSLRTSLGYTLKLDAETAVERSVSFNGQTVFSSGQLLYRTDLTAGTPAKTAINTTDGALTGTNKPRFCQWGDDLYIASGGELQKLDTSWDLTTVTGSPAVCDFVFVREARLWAGGAGDDFLYQSGIGDPTTWDLVSEPEKDWSGTTAADGKYVEIGYKDGADIVDVVNLSKDVVIFKRGANVNKAYRLTGFYPDWSVVEAGADIYCDTALSAYDLAFFMGANGLQALQTVQEYGEMKKIEAGKAINAWIAKERDSTAKLWNIPNLKQIWLKAKEDQSVWIYHPLIGDGGSFTRKKFSADFYDIWQSDDKVYCAVGNKIFLVDDEVATFDGNAQICEWVSKRIVFPNKVLITHLQLDTSNLISGTGLLSLNDRVNLPLTFGAAQDVFQDDTDVFADDTDPLVVTGFTTYKKNVRILCDSLEIRLRVNTGAIAFRNLIFKYAEVG